ncbi:hypothetical protein RHGRI_019598 [Rhododendron griersonianum]|uniref:Alpha-N-acetylglucosaminidase n=1 Tax=Rhododendron griersonianum TaxID=479676 RepID=A0AAV6JG45_9ERIC|nr:hypothetical protein RHGRI_019598 [Rhododendron griersonianum]
MRICKFLFLISILLLPISPSSSTESAESEAIQGLLTRLEAKRSPPSVQESAAKAILHRLLPTHVFSFQFKIVSKDICGWRSCFRISNYKKSSKNEPEIVIEGDTAVEIASGLHWYLKYWCDAHVSWDKTGGIQIASIPKPGFLPLVSDDGVMIQRPVPWNYYQNVVTSSYSYVWWDWERWEKEIDWMALQGINLPLAFTGQETIWQRVFSDFNITIQDLNDFFGGPAFLAWARMGNLHGWGGPLSKNWLDQQLVLQKQILSRMVEFGMTPVLPSFSGNVPGTLKDIFPSANITRLGEWNTINGDTRWCCTFLLDPSDPLFIEIGEAFIKRQMKEYGDVTDIYNCMFSLSFVLCCICMKSNLIAMSKADRDAVWLMQIPYKNTEAKTYGGKSNELFCTSDRKLRLAVLFRLIVLETAANESVCCTTSVGILKCMGFWMQLLQVQLMPVSVPIQPWQVGVGTCMEGIEQNPVVYELMSEMAFRSNKVQVQEWLKRYSQRRYGKAVHKIEAAWEILHGTIYNCTDGIADHNTDFIVKFPDWDPSMQTLIAPKRRRRFAPNRGRRFIFSETSSPLPQAHLWYSTQDVVNALKLFLDAGGDMAGSLTYRYDLVDLTRQVLSKLANQVYLDAIIAFRDTDAKTLSSKSRKFQQLIKDIDELLAADDNFLLGTWLESAKKLALNPSELKQYEWNARTQVTMWFDNSKSNQSKLHDYANKFWSGLLEGYYLPRASTFFSHLVKSLKENESFKMDDWRKEWISFSNKWQESNQLYPVKAQGDALAISKALYEKYFD